MIQSNGNLGVHGQGLLNLTGAGDTIEAQRLILSLFYSIQVRKLNYIMLLLCFLDFLTFYGLLDVEVLKVVVLLGVTWYFHLCRIKCFDFPIIFKKDFSIFRTYEFRHK